MLRKETQPVISGTKLTNALTSHAVLKLIKAKITNPISSSSAAMESWRDKTVSDTKRSVKRRRQDSSDDEEDSSNGSLLGKYVSDLKAAHKTIAALRSDKASLSSDVKKLQQQYDALKLRARRRRDDDAA
jgi:hypothetical protein